MFRVLSFLAFSGIIAGHTLSAADLKPMTLDNIASIQKNEDMTYSVICQNDSRETVTNVDLKLDNVCPKLIETGDLGILSIQKNADGSFQVVCTDKTVKTADKEEILEGNVCAPSEDNGQNENPVYLLSEGTYRANPNPHSFCEQQIRPHSIDGILTTLDLQFCSNSWFTLTCSENYCSGKHPNWPNNGFDVIPTAENTYKLIRYTNGNIDGEAIFTKISN